MFFKLFSISIFNSEFFRLIKVKSFSTEKNKIIGKDLTLINLK